MPDALQDASNLAQAASERLREIEAEEDKLRERKRRVLADLALDVENMLRSSHA